MAVNRFNVESAETATVTAIDPVWQRLRTDAEATAKAEPLLAGFIHSSLLAHDRFERALSYVLAHKLASEEMREMAFRDVLTEAFETDKRLGHSARADLGAILERDPACTTAFEPFLYYKGFHAVQAHRAAHWLWRQGRRQLARYIQSRVSEAFGVDIHPAAHIGRGIFIDHATGVVIGETAVVGDDCSLLHGVTLGGTGKETGDRHPKIERGVLIGAGAEILGNIRVGHCSKVAAGSVVLRDVPPNSVVAGVPAKIVGQSGCNDVPSHLMDQTLPNDARAPLDEPDFSI